jgi:hypothetical protein
MEYGENHLFVEPVHYRSWFRFCMSSWVLLSEYIHEESLVLIWRKAPLLLTPLFVLLLWQPKSVRFCIIICMGSNLTGEHSHIYRGGLPCRMWVPSVPSGLLLLTRDEDTFALRTYIIWQKRWMIWVPLCLYYIGTFVYTFLLNFLKLYHAQCKSLLIDTGEDQHHLFIQLDFPALLPFNGCIPETQISSGWENMIFLVAYDAGNWNLLYSTRRFNSLDNHHSHDHPDWPCCRNQ